MSSFRPTCSHVQTIELASGLSEDLVALVIADGSQCLVECVDNLLITSRQLADRPVAAKHQPQGAEGIQGDLDVGFQNPPATILASRPP